MFSILKFDLYKIIKSKTMMWFMFLPLLLIIVNPLLTYVIAVDNYVSVIGGLRGGGEINTAVMVFTCLFVSKDFSSGYVKNISSVVINKIEYILSKLICITIFCFVYVVVEFFIGMLFNFIFGSGVIYDIEKDGPYFLVSGFLLTRFTYILRGVTVGAFVSFFSILLKKEYVSVTILLIYWMFLWQYVALLVSKLSVLINVSLSKYMIFASASHQGWFNGYIFRDLLLPHIIFPLFYITIFTLFSWLLLKKRNM